MITLDHVADFYHRYRGEQVILSVRLQVTQPLSQIRVNLWLPPQLLPQPGTFFNPASFGKAQLGLEETQSRGRYQVVTWNLLKPAQLEPKQTYEFRVEAITQPAYGQAVVLTSWAEAIQADHPSSTQGLWHSELVKIEVSAKARRMNSLPSIYHDEPHEFLWRYLMIFDHVWELYEELLSNQAAYFDPHLTPAYLKTWLATWVGCTRYQYLPEATWQKFIPRLIPRMVYLNQQRGTKAGLIAYLQLWMGITDEVNKAARIQIKEAIVGNFILDDETRLGDKLIMGDTDQAIGHFTVRLCWPPHTERLSEDFIHEVIDAWKPAHTTYTLEPY